MLHLLYEFVVQITGQPETEQPDGFSVNRNEFKPPRDELDSQNYNRGPNYNRGEYEGVLYAFNL